MRIRRPFQILLLCAIVLIFFFPTLSAEICLVDDQPVLNALFNSDSLSLKDVFLPRSEHGGYYRPFIGLSYYLDKIVWDLDLRSMHLDNIVMHLINVLLLYCIMRMVLRNREGISSCFPLLAATLFALHPIVTESVNWISGRTDLMAGNFVLASTVFLLLYRSAGLKRYLIFAIGAIVLGIFSKEASFGMILASCFILGVTDRRGDENEDYSLSEIDARSPYRPSGLPLFMFVYALITIEVIYVGNYWVALAGCGSYFAALLVERKRLKSSSRINYKLLFLISGCAALTITLYILTRKLAYRSDVGKIGQAIKLMLEDTNYSISVFLGASGFYFKKFILPLPLNIYIIEIDPLYDLAGIFLLLFCLRLLTRLNLSSAFFIAGICMFLPALPFAFGTIAWTGYAERYIYISMAFWIVSSFIFINDLKNRQPFAAKASLAVVAVLGLFFGWQTYSRNIIWQKNVKLLADTVRQSPKARILREMYMYSFYQAGNIGEAKRQYTIAQSLHTLNYDGIADLTMANILTNEGKLQEALALLEKVVTKSGSSDTSLKHVIQHIESMLGSEKDSRKREFLSAKMESYKVILSDRSKDPMVFYNLGQKALAAHDNKAALGYFIRANSSFSPSSPYKRFSANLVDRLKREQM